MEKPKYRIITINRLGNDQQTGFAFCFLQSLAHKLDTTLGRVIAACAWAVTVATYFVLFWSTTGQTPGMRLLGLRVFGPDGAHLGVGRSLIRLVGLGLAIIPLFAGFLPVLFDHHRRALQDFLAGTVVRYDEFPAS